MNKNIDIKMVKYPYLAKCECCNRVKDIFYKANIYYVDPENPEGEKKYVMGDLDFCKNCGDNFARAIGNEQEPNESTVKTFKF